MEVIFRRVHTEEDINALCTLAKIAWHETYDRLLPKGQPEYMIEKFQSPDAVKDQMAHQGYEYYLILEGDAAAGFLGIAPKVEKEEELFLSKLYLLSAFHGRKIAGKALRFAESRAKELGLREIRLTVNKGNLHAKEVYTHYGFQVTDSVISGIGAGFVMDDFVMVKQL